MSVCACSSSVRLEKRERRERHLLKEGRLNIEAPITGTGSLDTSLPHDEKPSRIRAPTQNKGFDGNPNHYASHSVTRGRDLLSLEGT